MNKSIGIDLHGIINTHPAFFAAITQSLIKDGWSIHVLTGSHIRENNIEKELREYGIAYTHLFSIADYHKENKTEGMWYDKNGDPWVSDANWDKAKADYCKLHKIDFCIDDTARYANYFTTPFGYMSIQMHKDKPNKYLNMIINFFKNRQKKKIWEKIEDSINKKIGWLMSPKHKQGKAKQNSQYN